MKQYFTFLLLLPFMLKAQMTFTPFAAGKIPSGYIVNNIFSLNQDEIWAGASSNAGNQQAYILKTHDNGANWIVYKIDSSLTGYMLDLYVVNSSVAFAVLEDQSGNSYNYRTSDGGSNWKLTSNTYGVYVHAYTPSNVIMMGAASAWYSTDSFNTNTSVAWNQGGPPSFTPFGFNALSGTQLQFTSDSGVFFGYSKGSIVRTQDNGHHWKAFRTTLDSTSAASSIANSGNTIIALRRYLNNKGGLSRSADGGKTWVNKSDSVPSAAGIQTIASISTKPNYFLMGGYNNILKSTDGGLIWKNIPIPGAVKSAGVIHIAGVSNAWLGGDISSNSDAALYRIDIRENPSSVASLNNIAFKMYPNPSYNIVNFTSNCAGSFSILDMNGRTLMNNIIENGSSTIDIAHLPAGIYLVHFSNGNETIVKKLVKLVD